MKRNLKNIILLVIILGILGIITIYIKPILIVSNNSINHGDLSLASVRKVTRHKNDSIVRLIANFYDNFDREYVLQETGSLNESKDSNFWLSSGGYLLSSNGVGSTVKGELSSLDKWRVAYYISNSTDTDNGYHPQNIFRLVEKNKWTNYTQEAYFNIQKNNLSDSPNRNASNGILFFDRYQDAFNLYYTGVRVDGYAVIKKKINGEYYTMSYEPFSENLTTYDRTKNPNQLGENTWIGLRSVLNNNADGTVSIKLYTDEGRKGKWKLAAEALDDGLKYGGPVIKKEGYTGIRTDFMDVLFDDYKIIKN